MAEQEDNKKVAEDIGNSLGKTLKKSFNSLENDLDPEFEGIFGRQQRMWGTIQKIFKSVTSKLPTAGLGADMIGPIGKAVADNVPSADSLAEAIGRSVTDSAPSTSPIAESPIAESLIEENKVQQKSFSSSLISIRDSITSAFPKIIENIKSSLDPTADVGADLFNVKAIGQAVAESVPSADSLAAAVGADSAPSEPSEPSIDGVLTSAENLVEENKVQQESFSNSLTSIRDSITSAFPKIIENVKSSLSSLDPTADLGADLFSVDAIGQAVADSVPSAEAIGNAVAESNVDASKGNRVTQIEGEREAAKERGGLRKIFEDIRDSLGGSWATFKERDKKGGGLLAGLLGGVSGSGIGGLGKGIASLGKGLAVGLASLGAGIAAFFLALGTADWLLKWSGADGMALNKLIKNFFGAFDAKAAVMMGGLVAAGVAIGNMGKFAAPKLMAGMTAIGAGLVGFFAGLLLGEKGLGWMKTELGVDGSGIGKMFNTFFGAFTLTSGAMIMGLVAIGAAIASMGPFAPLKLIAGMTALGAGLVGFFAGILMGEKGLGWIKESGGVDGTGMAKMMKTFVSSFKDAGPEAVGALFAVLAAGAIAGMGKANPLAIVTGMTALGAGLVGFFGGLILAEKGAEWAMGDLMKAPPGENLAKLMKGFLLSFKGVGEEGLIVLGAILAAGAIIGMKKGMTGGLSVALGMTGMGMGIAGFFGGIALAEVGIKGLSDWAGQEVDGSRLSKMMKTFMQTFDGISDKGLIVMGALLAAGAAMGALLSVKDLIMVPLGMTALGAGIAGFFGGLALGETLMEKVSDWTGGKVSDGSVLAKFMTNFGAAFDGMSDRTLIIFGGLLAAGALIGVALPGAGPLLVALGMTALGAGIAGFFAGISLAGNIDPGKISNVADMMSELGRGIGGFIGNLAAGAMKGFLELDADKLAKVGEGIKGLGIGMLAFTGSQAVGAVGGAMETVAGWFGSDSPLERIAKFADGISAKQADSLSKMGRGIRDLGMGLAAMGGADPAKISASVGALKEMDVDALLAKIPEKTEDDKHEGGLVKRGGKYTLMAGETVMTPSQLTNMGKTMELLVGSQTIEQSKSGGPPVIINNVDNSQKTAVSSNRSQAINVPTAPHNSQSTKRMLDEAYAFG